MPFRLLNPKQPGEPTPPLVQTPPAKLGAIAVNPMVADYRMPTIWAAIMERSYKEANDKLLQTLNQDFRLDPQTLGALTLTIPCLVDLSEARTKREEESVRRAQKRMAHIYAGLIDRMFRYNPESYPYAIDWLKQEVINWRVLLRPYYCEVFRRADETEGKPKRKKKSSSG